jgi:DNA-binding NarL/FixJ family response regulator
MSTVEFPDHAHRPFVPRRLTKRQLSVVRDLADGCDIAAVAARRDRGVSSVYEIANRICDRLGLEDWRDIGPYAVEHGLLDGLDGNRPEA